MEKAGIPTVTMGYSDQINFFRNVALTNGCPNIRWVDVPRIGTCEERLVTYYDKIAKALIDPLTATEKEEGLYSPPAPARIIFEGSLLEAQDFLQQTILVENCRNCPIAKYTDGLPVVIPTEEAVAAMLTGTSHSPAEVIKRYSAKDANGEWLETGAQTTFAQGYTTTVEKVAVAAVMAGCKPEYMPVALAIAVAGGTLTACPGTSGPGGVSAFVVSGPIAKEIGMNPGQNALDIGNIANMTLGRFGALIGINAGGCITGIVRTDVGNAIHSICFPEDVDGLPVGWEGFNEESSYTQEGKSVKYTKNESVLGKVGYRWSLVGNLHSPGSTREMPQGTGGAARYVQARLGLPAGTPIYNWLEAFVPVMVQAVGRPGGRTFIFHPNMAIMLVKAGFATKLAGYNYLVKNFFLTAGYYSTSGWWDFVTDGGKNKESTSGLPYNDLPADYPIPALGTSPTGNCFIVSNGGADEIVYIWEGGRPGSYPIDPWR